MGDPREYVWNECPVPAGLPVTQVYGWLLYPATGRPQNADRDVLFCMSGS
jgi:hypothetical protein